MTRQPGIFQRIKDFFLGHGSRQPVRAEEEDPFTFFEEIAWLHESERIRKDALAFFDNAPHYGHPSRADGLSFAGKFAEKHTFVLSDREMMRLNALAGDEPADAGPGGHFSPFPDQEEMMADDWIRTTGIIGNDLTAHAPGSPADPLETLYEESGSAAAKTRSSQKTNDLYKAVIRMPLMRKMP